MPTGLEAYVDVHDDVVDVLVPTPEGPFDDDPEVTHSTKLYDFLTNLASKI